MPTNQLIKIVIVDDHAIFRTGLKTLFQSLSTENFQLVGEAANGQEAIELLKTVQPDIVIMDVEMPVLNGIEATAVIKREYEKVRTIALSYSITRTTVVEMVHAGADGYLLKDTNLKELTYAIRMVHKGVPYFTPTAAIHLAAKVREDIKKASNKKKELTKRETEILKRICDGLSSKEIANAMFVSKRTIDTMREKIMRKTGAKNLLQLLYFAIKQHIIKE